ncbi:hypothetical protein BRADI_2g28105v3 [Brachypodium distachyon]|uniref:Uncharacterized protein n=1 Tax=Brachypodium distachyon TaxID=15368 RepID=A0A2K2DB21_BRADI|nr:hypothetical protein BRADI_2g28105v3 [Brachypodium distachyon]
MVSAPPIYASPSLPESPGGTLAPRWALALAPLPNSQAPPPGSIDQRRLHEATNDEPVDRSQSTLPTESRSTERPTQHRIATICRPKRLTRPAIARSSPTPRTRRQFSTCSREQPSPLPPIEAVADAVTYGSATVDGRMRL